MAAAPKTLFSSSEVAATLHMSPQAFSNYKRRQPTIPKASLGNGTRSVELYTQADVNRIEKWFAKHASK